MKRASVWAGIFGAIIVTFSLFGIVAIYTSAAEITWPDIVESISGAAWLAFGAFLIALFIRGRQKDDAGAIEAPAPDSDADKARLTRRQDWIIAILLLIGVLGMVPNWFLNDYGAGLTVMNVLMIFDIAINAVLFWLAITLIRGTANYKHVLYAALLYGVVEAVLIFFQVGIWNALTMVPFTLYLVYALVTPMSRKTFRIAHFILLPLAVLLTVVFVMFAQAKIGELYRESAILESQFMDDTGTIGGAYETFFQKEAASDAEIESILAAIETRDARLAELRKVTADMQAWHEKQLPSLEKARTLQYLEKYLEVLVINEEQTETMKEFMAYAKSVNLRALTPAQENKINEYVAAIDAYQPRLTEAGYELEEIGAK